MINLCVIPARGGSRRIPHKNIRLFHGKPIIAYSIEAAQASGLFKYIVVSTDDEEIAVVSRKYGAWVMIRPKGLERNEVGTREVAAAVLDQTRHYTSHDIDSVCCLYATAPMVLTEDLIRGYRLLQKTQADHAISVVSPEIQDAAQFYWSNAWSLGNVEYFEEGTVLVNIYKRRVCDINTEDDWKRAERMYGELL